MVPFGLPKIIPCALLFANASLVLGVWGVMEPLTHLSVKLDLN